MPSAALNRWQTERMPRLGHTDAHCVTLFAPLSPAPPPPLAQESLQGYVMLVSGHFQGFCRDLYTECSQICAATVPVGFRATVQAQFAAELKLNSGNPTLENIRKDFERFGFLLNFAGAAPGNAAWVSHLPLELLEECRGPPEGDPTTARGTSDPHFGQYSDLARF